VNNLGFKGEWVFVKPGYAFNTLIPHKKALVDTDPDIQKVTYDVSVE
jgi:ribosomal protein L9